MKTVIIIFTFLTISLQAVAQVSQKYKELVNEAFSLYQAKDYKKAAEKLSEAFESNGWKGLSTDRYNAACMWSLAGVPDSAFFQLYRIATKANYTDYDHVTNDPDLQSLHQDSRWEPLLVIIKENKEKSEANLNKPLVAILDSIYMDDQKYRLQMDEVEKQYGWESKEMQELWGIIHVKDSLNLIKVKSILDQYGWLGPDVVGAQGNSTLFLVIQHSDQATQEKYLPMMREAVKNGRAQASSLALLEDRVALGQGRRQIYGSQIGRDPDTQQYYIRPLDDPDNVDKRRAEVGLSPLAEYVSIWNLTWDVEQYKKDLSEIEAKEKSRKN
jgi:hypothetical protein